MFCWVLLFQKDPAGIWVDTPSHSSVSVLYISVFCAANCSEVLAISSSSPDWLWTGSSIPEVLVPSISSEWMAASLRSVEWFITKSTLPCSPIRAVPEHDVPSLATEDAPLHQVWSSLAAAVETTLVHAKASQAVAVDSVVKTPLSLTSTFPLTHAKSVPAHDCLSPLATTAAPVHDLLWPMAATSLSLATICVLEPSTAVTWPTTESCLMETGSVNGFSRVTSPVTLSVIFNKVGAINTE